MILIVSATKESVGNLKSTQLTSSLNKDSHPLDFEQFEIDGVKSARANLNGVVDILYLYNNTTPLGKIYNKAIRYALDNDIYTTIIFVHDDVTIEDRRFETKVTTWLDKYDIIGLAGGDEVTIRKPCLWHIMSQKRFGTVGHYINNQWYGTTFGPCDQRVTLIDGLFMGIKTKTLRDRINLRFDETLPGFHHYDIDFCLQANKHKCKIGVVPILTTHNSPGLKSFSDPKYIESEKVFIAKWG